jgi:hypothetical protein
MVVVVVGLTCSAVAGKAVAEAHEGGAAPPALCP